MDCFFGSYQLPEPGDAAHHDEYPDRLKAVVTFHIPDIGVRFKAPFAGVNTDHVDFASLLALLEFIDSNQKYFSKHTYQIFGNNHRVIRQVNEETPAPMSFAPLMEKARRYREKYNFSLEWVPTNRNSAYDSLLD
jgi:hypothetical protein